MVAANPFYPYKTSSWYVTSLESFSGARDVWYDSREVGLILASAREVGCLRVKLRLSSPKTKLYQHLSSHKTISSLHVSSYKIIPSQHVSSHKTILSQHLSSHKTIPSLHLLSSTSSYTNVSRVSKSNISNNNFRYDHTENKDAWRCGYAPTCNNVIRELPHF